MTTRLAATAALCAVVLWAPAAALADDPPADQAPPPGPSCLPAQGSTDDLGLRGVRVGVKADIRDADGKPLNVKKVDYCVEGGGDFGLALTQESDVVLVLSTSEGDAIGPINPTSPTQSARAQFPNMKRLWKTADATVYRVDSRRQLILGVADGRVAYVAAADRLLLDYPAKLGYYLHRLGY